MAFVFYYVIRPDNFLPRNPENNTFCLSLSSHRVDAMFPRATTTTPVNARAHSNTIARSTSSRVARIASQRVATRSVAARRRDADATTARCLESEERTRIDAMGDDASVEGANDDANDAMDDIDAVEEMTRVLQTR